MCLEKTFFRRNYVGMTGPTGMPWHYVAFVWTILVYIMEFYGDSAHCGACKCALWSTVIYIIEYRCV